MVVRDFVWVVWVNHFFVVCCVARLACLFVRSYLGCLLGFGFFGVWFFVCCVVFVVVLLGFLLLFFGWLLVYIIMSISVFII